MPKTSVRSCVHFRLRPLDRCEFASLFGTNFFGKNHLYVIQIRILWGRVTNLGEPPINQEMIPGPGGSGAT